MLTIGLFFYSYFIFHLHELMISSIPIIKLIACEPSAAQVTLSYSLHLPAIGRFYQETKFSL